jgi:hypothetical protein
MKELLSRKIKYNRRISLACLLIGVIYFILIFYQASPREVPGARGFGQLTGRFFPQLGGGIFILCSVIMFVKSFLNGRAIKNTDDPDKLQPLLDENEAVSGVSKLEFRACLIIVVLGLIYVSVIPFLGYFIATVIAVFTMTRAMGNRNRVYQFILSFIVPLIIYQTFISVLYVPVPRGLLDLIGF